MKERLTGDITSPRNKVIPRAKPGAGALGELGLSAEDVTAAVEAASRADVVHAHWAVAVLALHEMRQVQVLVRSVHADA